jgi:methionyl-tRNA formyltransferase
VRLLSSGVSVCAIFLPSSADFGPSVRRRSARRSIPLSQQAVEPATIDDIAGIYDIRLFTIRRPMGPELEATLNECAPDMIVVSCFPWKIPPEIASTASSEAVNIHPSPLPRFRGPDPLFWAFRCGADWWGVTLHRIDNTLDGGPILGQRGFELPDELSGSRLETMSAHVGADLLIHLIDGLGAGPVEARGQRESEATYQTFPSDHDLEIGRNWTTRRAINFVAGVIPLGYHPYLITERGKEEVIAARPSTDDDTTVDDASLRADLLRMRLADGVVEFALRRSVSD